ncbi:trypsin-like peptidase domain-containing protein [Nonomuraea jabiensis]|uniref:VMAP-C domain-containing protein n=1 Tax=Nonomuraea jabiensis TaxID=882448 RepID=UPI003D765ED9
MIRGAWRARIDEVGAGARQTLGAGLLVSPNLVLTCAHVVRDKQEVRVAFLQAGRQDLLDLSATVHMRGRWRSTGNEGDVAVLKLEHEVDIPPAQLRLMSASTSKYVAHGFPWAHSTVGVPLTLAITADSLNGEWQSLHVVTPHGEPPDEGFSGAAVYDDATGEVIGMITDYSPLTKGTCRMLPIMSVRQHWEELDDLLDLHWLPPQERRALREIVSGPVCTTNLRQLVSKVFPSARGLPDFVSAWAAIRYVAEELHGEDRLARFLRALARTFTTETSQRRLRGWIRKHLSSDTAYTEPETAVIVRLDTVRDGYDIEISALIGNEPTSEPWRTTVSDKLEVRAQVEAGFTKIKRQVAGTAPMIEFVLPLSLLNEPVEEWEYGRDTPVVTHRAVLRYVGRLTDLDEWDPWAARAKCLSTRMPEDPQLLGCEGDDPKRLYMRLTKEKDVCVLVSTARPDDAILGKALHAGLPVIIWPRDPCAEPQHETCQAALRINDLIRDIATRAPADLPELIRKKRLQAYDKRDDEPHLGRNLALLWDDPERMPEPPAYMPD